MDINSYKQALLDQQKEKNEILLGNLTARREEVYFDTYYTKRKQNIYC